MKETSTLSDPPGNRTINAEDLVGMNVLASSMEAGTSVGSSADAWIIKDILPAGKHSLACRAFRRKWYPQISLTEWNDWQWQLKNRITRYDELSRMLSLSASEQQAFQEKGGHLPVAITPYYASLLSEKDPDQPLRKSMIPVAYEHCSSPGEAADPLGEEGHTPVPGLVHRYPDRVLFLTTSSCAAYCRYCTRSRLVGKGHHSHHSRTAWEKAIAYIAATPTIRDVLLSGGDPLTLPDEALEWLLSRLSKIPHIEIIRIGTKTPAVLPQRITLKLTRMLRKYHPLWISIHATHPDELTPEMVQACTRLADAGIPLGSQTVLLAGINDNVDTMRKLMHGLMKARVRPYYLYQCDPILGSLHFRTPVEKGIEIIRSLRGFTTGYAVPTYVIDAPGGGGKVPVMPEYVEGREGPDVILRNYAGKQYQYPDYAGNQALPQSLL